MTSPSIPASAARRLWANIEKTDGCWHWTGPRDEHGIPVYRVGPNRVDPGRIAYELTYGDVPSGVSVFEVCATPHCCRPDHHTRRDQFVPVPLGPAHLVQQMDDNLYPDIRRGDHVAVGLLPEPLVSGIVVLARIRRIGWIGLRRLVRCGDGWSLVTHSGLAANIPVTAEVELLAGAYAALRPSITQPGPDEPDPAA